MRRLAVAVLVLVGAGACFSEPAMTRQDARTFTERALHRLGFTEVRVSPEVTSFPYVPPESHGRSPIGVWRTRSEVENGGVVVLFVQRRGDSAVYVADVAPDGNRLFTDEQFQRLKAFHLNPADRRRHDRVHDALLPLVLPAVLLFVAAAVALFWTVYSGRVERTT